MTSPSRRSAKKSGSPEQIVVVDKATFRQWCAAMMLNAKQVSAILRVSLPMIYKYLDKDREADIRDITALACNLISEKPAEERLRWIKQQLIEQKCDDVWPAENPIKAEGVMP